MKQDVTRRLHLVPKPIKRPKPDQSYVVDMDCRFIRRCLWLAVLTEQEDFGCVGCPDRDHTKGTSRTVAPAIP
jgi:hypothetical protein